jgi:hypothetical protein
MDAILATIATPYLSGPNWVVLSDSASLKAFEVKVGGTLHNAN